MKNCFVFVLCLPTFTLVRHTSVLRFHTKMHLHTHKHTHIQINTLERACGKDSHAWISGRKSLSMVTIHVLLQCSAEEDVGCWGFAANGWRKQSVSREIRLAKCCSPNYWQVAQAAHMKQFDQRRMGGDELCFCGRKKPPKGLNIAYKWVWTTRLVGWFMIKYLTLYL